MRQKIQLILIYALILITLLVQTSCKASAASTDHVTRSTLLLSASEEPAATDAASAEATAMEATETAAAATALQVATTASTTKDTAAPTSTPQETTAAITTAAATAAPAQVTKPTFKPTSKPTAKESTSATTKATTAATTTAPAATTAAITAATTAAPAYFPNADNIRNLIIAQLQTKGLWFPDAEVKGDDSMTITTDNFLSDEKYANAYVNGKYGNPLLNIGCISVIVTVDAEYVTISSQKSYLA